MQQEVIISGFGGQGTLFAGQLLAHAAMERGKVVTWIPSYGPEMRGGVARCTVVVADEPIGAPLVKRPGAAIVLNIPSMEMFEPLIRPDGVLIVNSSLVPARSERTDIRVIYVPATDTAIEMGDVRLANAICLAALAEATGMVEGEDLGLALEHNLPERHRALLEKNHAALAHGAKLGAEA